MNKSTFILINNVEQFMNLPLLLLDFLYKIFSVKGAIIEGFVGNDGFTKMIL
jgi:hypothetical protein